jgi:uncharacterized protein (TIGR03083 family)
MPDSSAWIVALRNSHDRLASLLQPLDADDVRQPSYASDWSIADVASHLGSQAEIFGLFLAAGLSGDAAPGGEVFQPIWDRWNALPPVEQVAQSLAANEAFVSRLEQIEPAEAEKFALSMFGSDFDLAGLAAMRLSEHALHAWDIAVALDPSATVSADAVDLLIDGIAVGAARSGKPVAGVDPIAITTTAPERHFLLTVHPDVELAGNAEQAPDGLPLPAEALIRLVAGRLDPDHSPSDDYRLTELRTVFPGF